MKIFQHSFANGAQTEVHYYSPETIKRHYPGAEPEDVIRLRVRPAKGRGEEMDFFMTPHEATGIVSGLAEAMMKANMDNRPWHIK